MSIRLINKQKAQSLIEVVVALGLASAISISVLGLMVQAQILNLSTKQRIEANTISDQLIEQARSARDLLWSADKSQGNQYYFSQNSGVWQLETGVNSLVDGTYTAYLEINEVFRDENGNIAETGTLDPATVRVSSNVSWTTRFTRNLSQTTLLTRRVANRNLVQTDWFGGSGQLDWSDNTKYESDDGNVDVTLQPGEVRLAKKGRGGWQSGPDKIASLNLGSKVNDIIVVEDYAFVAGQKSDQSLMVIDINQKESPSLVATLNLIGPLRGLKRNGDYLYGALGNVSNGLVIIDISNPTNPTQVSSVNFSGEGNEIFINEGYAYMASSNNGLGLAIIDISNPNSPNLVSSLDVGSKGNDIFVSGDRAFISTDDGAQSLAVANISDKNNPSLMTNMATDGIYTRLDGKVDADQLYAASNNTTKGLVIIDISTPSSPTIFREMNVYDAGQAVYELDDYIYLGINDNDFGFQIVDNADKSSPARIGEENVEDSARAVFAKNDYAYVGTDDPQNGFVIVDIFSKMNVASVASVDVGEKVNGLAARDDYVYNATAHSWSSFMVANVDDPFNPRLSSFLSLIGKPSYEAEVLDNYAYICVDKNKNVLQVANINFPLIPFVVGIADMSQKGNDLSVRDGWVFVAADSNSEGLQSVQITKGWLAVWPRVKDIIDIGGKGTGISADVNYVYLSTDNPGAGLAIVDISDPFNLNLINNLDIGEAANDITVAGNYAYLATNSGVRVVNISDPSNPTNVSFFATNYAVNRLTVSEDFIFLACDDPEFGLLVIEADDVNNLELANQIKVHGRASDVEVGGDFASVGIDDPNNGLQIVWNGGGEEAGDRYARSGELISSTYDAGREVSYNHLEWSGDQPSQTDIKLQLAIKSQSGDPWQYFGPDGTDLTYFTESSQLDIPIDKALGRYIKYKLILEGPGTRTPILEEIRINYSI